jgi:hypothetical protein
LHFGVYDLNLARTSGEGGPGVASFKPHNLFMPQYQYDSIQATCTCTARVFLENGTEEAQHHWGPVMLSIHPIDDPDTPVAYSPDALHLGLGNDNSSRIVLCSAYDHKETTHYVIALLLNDDDLRRFQNNLPDAVGHRFANAMGLFPMTVVPLGGTGLSVFDLLVPALFPNT